MDSNLSKMVNYSMKKIKEGNFERLFADARDYIYYMNGHNLSAAKKEFTRFQNEVQQLSNKNRG